MKEVEKVKKSLNTKKKSHFSGQEKKNWVGSCFDFCLVNKRLERGYKE